MIDSTRTGFSEGLLEAAARYPRIALISTDSVKVVKAEAFAEKYPGRFFELGIAEQQGVDFCAGLAACGIIPYIATYAGFLTMRACEQIRTFVAYPNLKVRIIGANGGMAGGQREGVTHQFFEDIGILRTIPGITILVPADGTQVKKAVLESAGIDGPVYIRIGSGAEERFFDPSLPFEIGKIKTVADYGSDVAVISCGPIIHRALAAVEKLRAEGINAVLAESATIRPLDKAGIGALLGRCGRAVTVEDHQINGGLGSAVAELIAEGFPARLVRLGLQDVFPESGHADALLDAYGLGIDDIAGACRGLLTGQLKTGGLHG
jgi:transketolase